MRLLLKGGRVVDPSQGIDETASVLIEDGKIAQVGRVESGAAIGAQVYDVSGLVVTPGLIDMHVHMREPGFEHKETIETAGCAAAAGGFTTIVGMPNTKPAVDSGALVEYVLSRGGKTSVRVLTTGAATKANECVEMAEIGDMVKAGAVAISDDAFPVQSADLMRRVMEYSRMFDVPVLTHCEDRTMTADAVMNEGVTCSMLGLRPWPRQAEEIMIARNIALAELARCRLHIQHVTTAGGVDLVRAAKTKGLRVTAETCPQYFSLTDQALVEYDTNAKCCPPLRTQGDVDAVIAGLADGTIDVIATDHAPHSLEDKEVELQYAAFGMSGLETALGLTLTKLVETEKLSLSDVIAKLTIGPAKALGLTTSPDKSVGPTTGTLAVGADADITILDTGAKTVVRSSEFRSKGRNTPFEGIELTGRAAATVVGGKVVFGAETLKCEDAKASV